MLMIDEMLMIVMKEISFRKRERWTIQSRPSVYLCCACVLCLHDAFPPLQQPIVFRRAENMTCAKHNKAFKHTLKTSTSADSEPEEGNKTPGEERAEDVQTTQRLFAMQEEVASSISTIPGRLDSSVQGQLCLEPPWTRETCACKQSRCVSWVPLLDQQRLKLLPKTKPRRPHHFHSSAIQKSSADNLSARQLLNRQVTNNPESPIVLNRIDIVWKLCKSTKWIPVNHRCTQWTVLHLPKFQQKS